MEVVGPPLHEGAAVVEQIVAAVGSLGAVVDDVRQGEFADLEGRVGALGGLVSNAGSESMWHGFELEHPYEVRHDSVALDPVGWGREHEPAVMGQFLARLAQT